MVDLSAALQQLIRLRSSPTSFRSSSRTGRWADLPMQSVWGFQGAGVHKCWHVGGWIMQTSITAWAWPGTQIATRYLLQMTRMMSLIHLVNYQWQWLCVREQGTTGRKTGKSSIKLWFSFLIWKGLFLINIQKTLEVVRQMPRQKVLLLSHQPMVFLEASQLLRSIIQTSSQLSTPLRSSSKHHTIWVPIYLTSLWKAYRPKVYKRVPNRTLVRSNIQCNIQNKIKAKYFNIAKR